MQQFYFKPVPLPSPSSEFSSACQAELLPLDVDCDVFAFDLSESVLSPAAFLWPRPFPADKFFLAIINFQEASLAKLSF